MLSILENNNFHAQLYGNIFKIPNLQCIFWKTIYLYLNKYLEHTNVTKKGRAHRNPQP